MDSSRCSDVGALVVQAATGALVEAIAGALVDAIAGALVCAPAVIAPNEAVAIRASVRRIRFMVFVCFWFLCSRGWVKRLIHLSPRCGCELLLQRTKQK